MFFVTSAKFFSRYIPGSLVRRRPVPLSAYIRIIFCLFLGLSVLRVGSNTVVKNYERKSWSENPHVQKNVPDLKREYRVSLIFDLLSRTAEEAGALANRVVDNLFESTHSQVKVPSFFFKSIMYAASATIEDQALKDQVDYFTAECFERLIPLLPASLMTPTSSMGEIMGVDGFLDFNTQIDQKLGDLVVKQPGGRSITCQTLKVQLRQDMRAYAMTKSDGFDQTFEDIHKRPFLNSDVWMNLQTSSLLVNHFLDQKEGRWLGVQKGAEVEGATGAIYHSLGRVFSFSGLMGMIGLKDVQGASLSANRAQEFSEDLVRAPHVAGFTKLILITIFPALVFFIVAGNWKVLFMWFVAYLSVVLWAPIWTLLYHVMTNIALSVDVMEKFGQLSTGVSLYGAKLIGSKIYHLYSVYSWLQVLIGPAFTILTLYMFRPMFTDTQGEEAPEFVGTASKQADSAGGVVAAGTKALGAL